MDHSVITLVTEPLTHAFMQRALLMAVLVAVVCALFSSFLVLKGWALMGDAVSHAVLPGLALAAITGLPLAIGAFAAGLGCALATGFLKDHSRLKEDAVMGVVFSGMFALGLVMLSRIDTDLHLMHILFGHMLGIGGPDLVEAAFLSIVCSLILWVKRHDFLAYCFDPAHAHAIGLRVRVLHFGLLIMLALTIVAALKAVGIILVIAMLIAPGALGFLMARSFAGMMGVAVSSSVLSCVIGVYISYYADVTTAPVIVLVQMGFFILLLIGQGLRRAVVAAQAASA